MGTVTSVVFELLCELLWGLVRELSPLRDRSPSDG